MKSPKYGLFVCMIVLVITSLACGLSAPVPTVTPTPLPPTATSVPSATPIPVTATLAPPFEIGQEYNHPSGLFSLTPPKDWELSEKPYGAVFVAPDQSAFIGITVTNTIFPLSQDQLNNFITANEENRFGSYAQYKETLSELHLDQGFALVGKTLVDENNIPQAVLTFYGQDGAAVYVMHQWANADNPEKAQAFFDQYTKVTESFKNNSSTIANYPAYPWTFHVVGANNIYEIDIPQPWAHTREEPADMAVDTFLAPDQNSAIQILVYDDGKTKMNQAIAGQVALSVLNQSYTNGADDIKIISDKPGQAQGTERLDWKSKTGGYQGVTFFQGRGNTLVLLSFLFVNGYEDDYQFMVDYTMSTYILP
jgi:hypothetical protein